MKYKFSKVENNKSYPQYEVDISVKAFVKPSKEDKEKLYKVLRVIDTLGEDMIKERSDKDYRFRTDQDTGDVLEGLVKECKAKSKKVYDFKNPNSKDMFGRLGLKK